MKKQTFLEKPDNLATITLVQSKLKDAGIVFEPEELVLENGTSTSFFKEQLLKRNQLTVMIFTQYCLLPTRDIFLKKKVVKLSMESDSFLAIFTILLGYMEAGFASKIETVPHKDYAKFVSTLPSLFKPEEIEAIIACLKCLLSDFPQIVEETIEWFEEDIEPQKNQINVLKDFINLLQTQPTESEELKKVSEKVLEICMPGEAGNDHNLYTKKVRKRLGLYTPVEQLIINIEIILIYLDVISYAGLLPDSLPKKASELNFF